MLSDTGEPAAAPTDVSTSTGEGITGRTNGCTPSNGHSNGRRALGPLPSSLGEFTNFSNCELFDLAVQALIKGEAGRPHAKSLSGASEGGANFPPPKPDKPRPHICATCGRSFARLEHLKRHERSHTKEKPFECPECTRCFARRDLLLRHQQKLHMTAMPTSRQKGGRRESTSSAVTSGSARVRKSSIANNASGSSGGSGAGSMRPRANTISHVDNATMGMIAAANSSVGRTGATNLDSSHILPNHGLPGVGGYTFRGMSTALGNHGNPHVLPKLDTHGLGIDVGASLRTAPAYASAGNEVDMHNSWYGPASSTINPAQLHFTGSPHFFAYDTPASPYQHGFPPMPQNPNVIDDDGNFTWLHGFENQMSFHHASNEQAIDNSSPSAMSTGSHDGLSEVMLDGSNHPISTSSGWQAPMGAQIPISSDYPMDLSASAFSDVLNPGQVSPKSMQGQFGFSEHLFSSPPPLNSQTSISMMQGLHNNAVHPPIAMEPDTPSNSAASTSSSHRHSSVTSVSTDSITDATRQALINSLCQSSGYGQHQVKSSQPQVSSPLSPEYVSRSRSTSSVPLPSTYDLQRYVAAYIQYFHPHLPFLHVPSLSFDSPVFTSSLRAPNGHLYYGQAGIAGGGGALILAMAAIGAFYEYETTVSKDLFEMAKKVIQIYLDERRKIDFTPGVSGANNAGENPTQNTPLWLVQAMLLNVIYGHNCGDKTSASIASTHCAALVSLARAAELAMPSTHPPSAQSTTMHNQNYTIAGDDVAMTNGDCVSNVWNVQHSLGVSDLQAQWYEWKLTEERKRTLYAVFVLSSMLVSAYNHAPALMNSEIKLDLPCDEDLWAADSAEAWRFLREAHMAEQKPISFASALSSLLTASQREVQHRRMSQSFNQPFGSGVKLENIPESDITPSTFGCLILINALHNYIWETRQRHVGRQWTIQETEAMHAHIEPALRAWQAAWASNPQHSLARPNPSGASSLSADCIPLLDLAYVRLFVNFGRSKEAFFRRDFDAMCLEAGAEIQQADRSPTLSQNQGTTEHQRGIKADSPVMDGPNIKLETSDTTITESCEPQSDTSLGQTSKRERHLRKAAFFAANSLAMADKLGVTFADFDSRELPMSSAMCAFDCAQVLAEWVCTVQQRVGRYLGILGRDDIDFGQVPAIMLLEDEDGKLFEKIRDIISSAETKLANNGGSSIDPTMPIEGSYGSKLLLVTAQMLYKAGVWPSKMILDPLQPIC